MTAFREVSLPRVRRGVNELAHALIAGQDGKVAAVIDVVAVATGGLRGEVREYGRIANTFRALERLLRKLGGDGVWPRFATRQGVGWHSTPSVDRALGLLGLVWHDMSGFCARDRGRRVPTRLCRSTCPCHRLGAGSATPAGRKPPRWGRTAHLWLGAVRTAAPAKRRMLVRCWTGSTSCSLSSTGATSLGARSELIGDALPSLARRLLASVCRCGR
jgi:hypothetical protein